LAACPLFKHHLPAIGRPVGNQKFTIAHGFGQLNPFRAAVPELFKIWLKSTIKLKGFRELALHGFAVEQIAGRRQSG
jgi:hypothetical protein